MDRTRMKSELLATLSLGAGDKLAFANVLAALVALPNRAVQQLGVGPPGLQHRKSDCHTTAQARASNPGDSR